MPSLGPLELFVVGVLALIVFGPQKLPEIARTIGRAINEFRRQAADLRAEFEQGIALDDEDEDEPSTTETISPSSRKKPEEAEPADPPAGDETAAERVAPTPKDEP